MHPLEFLETLYVIRVKMLRYQDAIDYTCTGMTDDILVHVLKFIYEIIDLEHLQKMTHVAQSISSQAFHL